MTELLRKDMAAAEAGRLMMAQQLEKILFHETAVRETADPLAVHEMRKAIRRTFTAFRLFGSYFMPVIIEYYRRRLRRLMRRLGRSRDLHIMREHLAAYEAELLPLPALRTYWDQQQQNADDALRTYLAHPKRQTFLERYHTFCATPGMGVVIDGPLPFEPTVAFVAPSLIYERLAAVRATGAHLQQLSVPEMHQLRIQFKELRYTLDFLVPILGPQTAAILQSLNDIQDHLGALNDSRVALVVLDDVPDIEEEVARYRAFQARELARQVAACGPFWNEIDRPAWRYELAAAIADL